jgi:hypothetical protein
MSDNDKNIPNNTADQNLKAYCYVFNEKKAHFFEQIQEIHFLFCTNLEE